MRFFRSKKKLESDDIRLPSSDQTPIETPTETPTTKATETKPSNDQQKHSKLCPFGSPFMETEQAGKKFGDKASTPLQLVKFEQNIQIIANMNLYKTQSIMQFKNFH